MGELILCGQTLAALPFYLESAALNVYSLEELSYYIEHNLYLLEADFMSEELCAWVAHELHLEELSKRMRRIYQEHGTISEFVQEILAESGYCSKAVQKQIAETLREMEQKSEFERGKLRADRYLENQKYVSSIMEYRRLLEMDEENTIMVGNVWHNMGSAYAKLFLFGEAAHCYRSAYEKNSNPESLRECLYAFRCANDEAGFADAADAYQMTDEERTTIGQRIKEALVGSVDTSFDGTLDKWFDSGETERIFESLNEWVCQYRKNCKI